MKLVKAKVFRDPTFITRVYNEETCRDYYGDDLEDCIDVPEELLREYEDAWERLKKAGIQLQALQDAAEKKRWGY